MRGRGIKCDNCGNLALVPDMDRIPHGWVSLTDGGDDARDLCGWSCVQDWARVRLRRAG